MAQGSSYPTTLVPTARRFGQASWPHETRPRSRAGPRVRGRRRRPAAGERKRRGTHFLSAVDGESVTPAHAEVPGILGLLGESAAQGWGSGDNFAMDATEPVEASTAPMGGAAELVVPKHAAS